MDDDAAKERIQELLAVLTPGSILHLLGEVLLANDEKLPSDLNRQERIRQAEATLFVVGMGIDSVVPH